MSQKKIPFNRPYFSEKCLENIRDTVRHGCQSGDGFFSKSVYELLRTKYGFAHSLLVTSCTHALEMMAMLLNIGKGDEIIIPSYTFVSTANAFVKFGAKIVFADSKSDEPNINPELIKSLISPRTKALCIVHYAGWGCDMDDIVQICLENKIVLLEDAAQAIHSFYKKRPLGSFGAMSAFSFHETKNVNCGEGGLLVLNDPQYSERAEIIREKGTNRTSFFKGVVNKYEWVDIGSSYLLSDINAAYLLPQLQDVETIIEHRKSLWERYEKNISNLTPELLLIDNKLTFCKYFELCKRLENREGNYHIFYLLFHSSEELKKLQSFLKENNIHTTTHYVPLHKSKYYLSYNDLKDLPNACRFSQNLLRLPLYNDLTVDEVDYICHKIQEYLLRGNA